MPRLVWAIRNKEGRAFSFDGPPTDAYTTYIKKSEYDKAIEALKEVENCGICLSRGISNGAQQTLIELGEL